MNEQIDDLARGRSKVVHWWRARLPGLVLWELWATSRRMEGPLCAADGACVWVGGGRRGWRWTGSQRLPPPAPVSHRPTWVHCLRRIPRLWGWREGGRWGSHLCTAGLHRQGPSLRERQKWLLMETTQWPQLESCQFLFSLTSGLLSPLLLLTVSWSASHFCFVGCSYRVRPVWFYCWSF